MEISGELEARIYKEIDRKLDALEVKISEGNEGDEDYLIGVREGLLQARDLITSLKFKLRNEKLKEEVIK